MNRPSAIAIVALSLAAVVVPPEKIKPSAWAAMNLIVPDGPRKGELWDPSLTPYIVEPLDLLGPDTGVNELAVMKSAQTGFTTLLLAATGHTIECDPCDFAILQPTEQALADFNRLKLLRALEGSTSIAALLAASSTTYAKEFPKGSLTLLIASSAPDLRSKTLKKLLRDEVDEYPDNLGDQGDPLEISDARLTTFLASGDWKKADISTPTVKGASKIEQRHATGDQRRWHVDCPHCHAPDGSPSVFVFGPDGFKHNESFPFDAHFWTPCCGVRIDYHEKDALVRAGRWIATAPRLGAYPSYHFDVFSSPFVPWDKIAEKIVAAGDDPQKLKALWNLWFGLPYEVKGDAPDHVRLMERREEGLKRYHVPARGLMLVAAADVQMRGIWYDITAYAPNRERWTVDAGYCDGDTSAPDGEAFQKLLAATVDRTFEDAFGNKRSIDVLGVDSGFSSHAVYAFVRNSQRLHPDAGLDMLLALDGRDGWGKPAIGTPKLVDIDLAGHRVKQGCKLWPVGTWPLKGAWYADLHKEGVRSGREKDPGGYCHFPMWLDEAYFRQITAEYLADETVRGRTTKKWKPRQKDNHLLDCRIYGDALAEYLGLSSTTADEWAALARRRGLPDAVTAPDLFKPAPSVAVVPSSPPLDPPAPSAPSGGWLAGGGNFWRR